MRVSRNVCASLPDGGAPPRRHDAHMGHPDRFTALIAGGGVAALETMIALRSLAEERVEIELLSPDRDFFYRPLSVYEPFAGSPPVRFDLGELTAGVGARHRLGSLRAVDPVGHTATTQIGEKLEYDALVLALGARRRVAVPGALTYRGHEDATALKSLLHELESGSVATVAFVVASGVTWPLPAYELALQTAARLGDGQGRISLVTTEEQPLGLFGREGSEAVGRLLAERGIGLRTSAHPERFADGLVHMIPGPPVPAERAVALPALTGIRVAGVPSDAAGYVHTDPLGRVVGMDDVYAAGDGTTFPIKQGGLASQQADAVAGSIAAKAGAPVRPEPFDPVLRALVVTGTGPIFLRAELGGGHMYASESDESPLWWPPAKIAARHLGPYLAERATGLAPFALPRTS
jgi:sulfide:quinone oxidoreductase